MLKNTINRIIIAALFIIGLFLLIFASHDLVLLTVLTIWIYAALDEFYNMLENKATVNRKLGLTIGALTPSLIYFNILSLGDIISISVVIMMLIDVLSNKRGLARNAYTLFSIIYIAFPMSHLALLFNLQKYSSIKLIIPIPYGRALLAIVFLLSSGTDTMSYITGRIFGRNLLVPKISPKKTIEGFIGAIIWGILVGTLIWNIEIFNITLLTSVVFGALGAAIAQAGDLAASLIKRDIGVKDSSNVFASHGGLLDRCDSIIFVAPFVYYFIKLI